MALAKDSLVTVITRFITVSFSMVTSIALARLLAPAGRGEFALFSQLLVLASGLAALGLGAAYAYYLSNGEERQEEITLHAIFASLLLGSLASATIFVLYRFLPTLFGEISPALIWFAGLLIPFALLEANLRQLLLGRKRILSYNVLRTLRPLLFMVLLLGLAIAGESSVWTAVWGFSGALVLTVVAGLFLILRSACIDWGHLVRLTRKLFSYGLRAYVGNIFLALSYRLDVFLINFFLGSMSLGYYAVAVNMAEVLLIVPYAVGSVLFPYLSSQAETAADTAARTSRILLLLALAAGLFLGTFGHILLPLMFSEEYTNSISSFRLLLPGVITMSVNYALMQAFSASNRPGLSSFVLVVGVILNVIANIVLIPSFGIQGAAVASTLSYSLTAVMSIYFFYRIFGIAPRQVLLVQLADLTDLQQILRKQYRRIAFRNTIP